MKQAFKKIVLWCLHKESAYLLRKHNPTIIALTGSVGKTTTKDALYTVLRSKLHIRKNQKSFNSEIGVPLTILGLPNAWNNPFKWILNIVRGGLRMISKKPYPTHLILEIGVERPGDIDVLTKWITPDVVVLTALPQIPVHVESFEDKEAVWREKRQLVNACKKGGVIVLNYDDEEVRKTLAPEGCTTITYGTEAGADHRAVEITPCFRDGDLFGEQMNLIHGEKQSQYTFEGVLGWQSVLPFVAASAVQEALGIEDQMIDVASFEPAPGRMRILKGLNKTTLIDDTYNSSPIALQKGLEETARLPGERRKIAILGDMLELGQQSVEVHRSLGAEVTHVGFDLLITVGIRGAHFAEGAHGAGMPLESIASFPSSTNEDLLDYLDHLIEEGDLIYLKGSQGSRMEKVTAHLLAEDLNPEELLPRHDRVWLNK